jgi:hypothetical protein
MDNLAEICTDENVLRVSGLMDEAADVSESADLVVDYFSSLQRSF